MKTWITLTTALISLTILSSEPDVDYHVVNTTLYNGDRIEIELNPMLDGFELESIELEAKNVHLGQANLLINGITLAKKVITTNSMDKYVFETKNNAIVFGYNLDTIEIEAKGVISIKHVILQAK